MFGIRITGPDSFPNSRYVVYGLFRKQIADLGFEPGSVNVILCRPRILTYS